MASMDLSITQVALDLLYCDVVFHDTCAKVAFKELLAAHTATISATIPHLGTHFHVELPKDKLAICRIQHAFSLYCLLNQFLEHPEQLLAAAEHRENVVKGLLRSAVPAAVAIGDRIRSLLGLSQTIVESEEQISQSRKSTQNKKGQAVPPPRTLDYSVQPLPIEVLSSVSVLLRDAICALLRNAQETSRVFETIFPSKFLPLEKIKPMKMMNEDLKQQPKGKNRGDAVSEEARLAAIFQSFDDNECTTAVITRHRIEGDQGSANNHRKHITTVNKNNVHDEDEVGEDEIDVVKPSFKPDTSTKKDAASAAQGRRLTLDASPDLFSKSSARIHGRKAHDDTLNDTIMSVGGDSPAAAAPPRRVLVATSTKENWTNGDKKRQREVYIRCLTCGNFHKAELVAFGCLSLPSLQDE